MLEFDDSSESTLVHEHTTGLIIGASFEVHRQLGYGFLERVYQRALQVELLFGTARPPKLRSGSKSNIKVS
jgi:hypothetical protein